MTINKSQGQSLNTVGVDLQVPMFCHGQLYVALSRVTNVANMTVLLSKDQYQTTNIMYPKVLKEVIRPVTWPVPPPLQPRNAELNIFVQELEKSGVEAWDF